MPQHLDLMRFFRTLEDLSFDKSSQQQYITIKMKHLINEAEDKENAPFFESFVEVLGQLCDAYIESSRLKAHETLGVWPTAKKLDIEKKYRYIVEHSSEFSLAMRTEAELAFHFVQCMSIASNKEESV